MRITILLITLCLLVVACAPQGPGKATGVVYEVNYEKNAVCETLQCVAEHAQQCIPDGSAKYDGAKRKNPPASEVYFFGGWDNNKCDITVTSRTQDDTYTGTCFITKQQAASLTVVQSILEVSCLE